MSPGEARVSSVLPWGQGLWLQQTWEAQCVAQVLLEEVTFSASIEPLSRQPTIWRTMIPKKGPQQISPPGDPAKGQRNSREFYFEGQWDLIIELLQD